MDSSKHTDALEASGRKLHSRGRIVPSHAAGLANAPSTAPGKIAAAIMLMLIISGAETARAQTPFLQVDAIPVNSTGADPSQALYNQPGPNMVSCTTGSQSTAANANYGLRGASRSTKHLYIGPGSNNGNTAKGDATFADKFLFYDPSAPIGKLLSYSVTTTILGSQSESSGVGREANASFSVNDYLDYFNASEGVVDNEFLTMSFLNQNGVEQTPNYAYISSLDGHINSATYLGGPNISVMLPNDSEMFFESQVSAKAGSQNGVQQMRITQIPL